MDQTAALAREFERESYRIDQSIWDAMALRSGESALFCGFSNNVDWIKRAVAIGVDVSVISDDTHEMANWQDARVHVLRGSTSMLPARDASFDVTVAFHYLHEVDPFFHANIITELGRVGKRCVIVEPAPPSDPLGLRIAALYSRAKRGLGEFENYHHIDYWRKLLSIVKSDVTYQTFAFLRTPPREAIRGTVALIIDTMAAEQTPQSYLDELRALAKRPDAQLLPQARYVIVGTASGVALNSSAGTNYRDRLPDDPRLGIAVSPAAFAASAPRVYSAANTRPEFPSVEPVAALTPVAATTPVAASQPAVAQAPSIARNAFGLPAREDATSRAPVAPSVKGDDAAPAFGLPDDAADAAAEFGWEWETPGTP